MIIIGADHSGIELKDYFKKRLEQEKRQVLDVSNENYQEGDDYTDISERLCKNINKDSFGIMICGTGIGSSIIANKIKGIRAAVCCDNYTAKMTRLDNDANVLCLGARTKIAKNKEFIYEIVKTFLNTPFSNEERHLRRLEKISKLENGGTNI